MFSCLPSSALNSYLMGWYTIHDGGGLDAVVAWLEQHLQMTPELRRPMPHAGSLYAEHVHGQEQIH